MNLNMTNPKVTPNFILKCGHKAAQTADRAVQFGQRRKKKTQRKREETFEINSLSVQVETNNMDQ